MLAVNLLEVVAEVKVAFNEYENVLMSNDVQALIKKFWQHPDAVRFGVNENLYGWEQIVKFRQQRNPPLPRTLMHTVITTFGHDYANISTEFKSANGDLGRQMQSWIRTDDGWRIVAAHISLLPLP
jgi:glutaredoxin-related protein